MLVFATADDYTIITGAAAPPDFATLLPVACRWVRDACAADVFDLAPDGLPADDLQRQALAEATCLQIQLWAALGVDPIAGVAALKPTKVSSGIDGASVTYQVGAQDQARVAAVTSLCQASLAALHSAGLGGGGVVFQ